MSRGNGRGAVTDEPPTHAGLELPPDYAVEIRRGYSKPYRLRCHRHGVDRYVGDYPSQAAVMRGIAKHEGQMRKVNSRWDEPKTSDQGSPL